MINPVLLNSPSNVFYPVSASTFDRTASTKMNDIITTTSSDSVTISLWVKFNSSSTSQQQFFSYGTGASLLIAGGKSGGSNKLFFQTTNSSGTFTMVTVNNYTNANGWINYLISVNTNFAAGSRLSHMYINGISDKNITLDIGIAFPAFNYAATRPFQIGSNDNFSSVYFDGSLAEIYIDQNYTDLSILANRRKFISATKRPVFLGSNGSLPTGTQPLFYLKGSGTGFNINSGSGGNFTTSGTLTVPLTTPSQP